MVRPRELKFGMRVSYTHSQLVLSQQAAQQKKVWSKTTLTYSLELDVIAPLIRPHLLRKSRFWQNHPTAVTSRELS